MTNKTKKCGKSEKGKKKEQVKRWAKGKLAF